MLDQTSPDPDLSTLHDTHGRKISKMMMIMMTTTCDDNDGDDDVKKDIPPISLLGMIHLVEKYFSLANTVSSIS